MKTVRLLFASLLMASVASTSTAQHRHRYHEDRYEPTVYLISVTETDTMSLCNSCRNMQQRTITNNIAMQQAIADYNETHRTGFQQVEKPLFIFTTNNNKFSLALGGYINLRASYGFDGLVNNIDFVPYDIPIPGNFATKQRVNMDASTSRVYLKAIMNSRALGRVVVFIDSDFRGGDGTTYTPRVRSAYVMIKGFTMGRDITTFCDLNAAPQTIDFRGPNAYNLRFSTLIRYEIPFANNHLKFGVAAELPRVSATYGAGFQPIPQRIPDIPAYFQVSWGKNRQSHLRASGVFRDMHYYNTTRNTTDNIIGWGVQASGNIMIGRVLNIYFNGIYGEGITPYIQDLAGSGLDFAPNPENAAQLQTTPMYAWQAAAKINLAKKLSVSGGYSAVTVRKKNGFYADNEYRFGQYIFGNIFYNITPRFTIAGEFLYGKRQNMNDAENHANRVNVMAQFNF
ncbi:MAG: porin [Alistipes sp.]|nr:porin [Alistipes sp.]